MPAIPSPVKKSLWGAIEKAAGGGWNFVKKTYGPGMARDETVLRGLVRGRYEARKGFNETRKALEAAERGPKAVVSEAIAKGDAKIDAFNKGMSDMNKDALADLWHTGDEHAYDVARAQMELHAKTEGAKVVAEAERLAKAGKEEAARLATQLPGAREAFTAAEKRFNEAVTLVQQRRDLEASWFGFTKNEGSHLWSSGIADHPLVPAAAKSMKRPGHFAQKTGAQVTGVGFFPRIGSIVTRGVTREVMPFQMQGRFGRFLDPQNSPLTSPGAFGILASATTAGLGGLLAAKKMGIIPPPLPEQMVAAQNALDEAKKGTDPKAIAAAQKAYDDLKARAGKKAENPPTVEQSVTRHTLASVAQDYARTGDAAKRDEILATMDPERLKGRLGEIRRQVFSFHNPGSSIDQFEKSEDGRRFIEEFDRDVFGSMSAGDWLTTDLDAYQRKLEEATAWEGN